MHLHGCTHTYPHLYAHLRWADAHPNPTPVYRTYGRSDDCADVAAHRDASAYGCAYGCAYGYTLWRGRHHN